MSLLSNLREGIMPPSTDKSLATNWQNYQKPSHSANKVIARLSGSLNAQPLEITDIGV